MAAGEATGERLWREQYAALVRTAWLLTGNRHDAEDAVVDAWLSCASRLDAVERPAAYLQRAVVNACHGRHRRRQAEQRALARVGGDDWCVPEHLVEFADMLQGLNHRARVVVVMRLYLGVPDDEVGQALGCATDTVRVIFHRAVKQLRRVTQ